MENCAAEHFVFLGSLMESYYFVLNIVVRNEVKIKTITMMKTTLKDEGISKSTLHSRLMDFYCLHF